MSAFDGFLHEKHSNEEAEQLPAQPSKPACSQAGSVNPLCLSNSQ